MIKFFLNCSVARRPVSESDSFCSMKTGSDPSPLPVHAAERVARLPSRRALLSLQVLVAFGLFSSPARAMPAASMQLFRMDGKGVHAVPAVSAAIEALNRPPVQMAAATQSTVPSAPMAAATEPVAEGAGPVSPAAQAPGTKPDVAAEPQGVLVAQSEAGTGGLQTLSQTFQGAFPTNVIGNIRIVTLLEDGTLGKVVEEIPFNSSRVVLKPLDSQFVELSVQPTAPLQPGQSVMMQLPSTSPTGVPYSFPGHLASTPCTFTGAAASTATAAGIGAAAGSAAAGVGTAAAAGAAAASFPVLAVVIGVALVGGIVAAVSGAFSGNGGTTASSQ